MIGLLAAIAPFAFMAGLIVRNLIIWRTTYENHAWWRMTDRRTGQHRWVRKPHAGYSPIPWLDDDASARPLGPPPSRPTR